MEPSYSGQIGRLRVHYHPIYSDGIHPKARFPRDRYRLIADRMKHHAGVEIAPARCASYDELCLAHDPAFVDAFLASALDDKAIRRIGLRPWTDSIIERTQRLVGGSLMALEDALSGVGIGANLAGGTHHAYSDFGSGYCIFNDIAICARQALQKKSINKILVLDLDVHQGDGTAEIFQNDPDVFTCSIHCHSNFPFRKQKSDLDVGLPDHIEDDEYLGILDQVLRQVKPQNYDLILYQAGVDTLKADALGKLDLSREGLKHRNRKIFSYYKEYNIPIVIFMGGGYSNPINATVDSFEDLFGQASRLL